MAELDSITAAIAIDTARRNRALASQASAPATPEANVALSFQPGERVFDLVTGQEGIVNAGQQAHHLIPAPAE